jgi:peptidoglycan-N-acetylglucosamine deacetylase
MKINRRAAMRAALVAAGGVACGAVGTEVPRMFGWDRPPLSGGYAAAADAPEAVRTAGVTIRYYVETTEPVVAFTFDDGPAPQWTPMVLDALDEARIPATFFMVGRNLQRHADLVRDRMARHEVGNHSWSHDDLATLNRFQVDTELSRTHEAIEQVFGRSPRLLRPPYGHLGGSTVLAANAFGYDLVLWSHLMRERYFANDPEGQVRDIVDNVRPGSIILAHDVGKPHRLLALRGLGAMVTGLKARGFRFATVSQLAALREPTDQHAGRRHPHTDHPPAGTGSRRLVSAGAETSRRRPQSRKYFSAMTNRVSAPPKAPAPTLTAVARLLPS